MSEETIKKLQSLTKSFITNTGLKEFNTESFIDSIKYMVDHLSWERDDVYDRYMDKFFSLYEQSLVSDVMPAIINGIQKGSSSGIDAGKIYDEYNNLMKHVMAQTAPMKVIEAAFEGEVDVDEFRENPDMNLNAFDVTHTVFNVESKMNKLELAILNTPAYKRIIQIDEELQKKHPQFKATYNRDNANTLNNMIHEMNDGKISDTKFADFSEAKKTFVDNLNKVSTQYMVVRNQYMKLSFWNKWMTQEGRDLGGALRDTKKSFTKMNENIEREFGKKAVDNISEAIHKSAEQILDREGAREFHQATESIRQQITISLDEYEDIKEEINDDVMYQRDFVKKAYKEDPEPTK